MDGIVTLRNRLVAEIIDPLLYLIFALGLVVFLIGMVEFIYGLSSESDARARGKKHMVYGLIGMFVMMTAFAIVRLIAKTVGGPSGVVGG